MALTAKQKMFVTEYLIDLNATQSAIRAGYSVKTARQIGEQNLSKLDIQKAIQKAMNERAKRNNITADKVLNEIAGIAFDDIGNYLNFFTDAEGNVRTVIKDSKTISTKNISEISCGRDGTFKFKLYCKDNALALLGKHLKLFTDKLDDNDKHDSGEADSYLDALKSKVPEVWNDGT